MELELVKKGRLLVCGVCNYTVAPMEEGHADCMGVVEMKKTAKRIMKLLPKEKFFEKVFRELRVSFSFARVRKNAVSFYETVVRFYGAGALAVVSAKKIKTLIESLGRLARLIGKQIVFQGNVCLSP